LTADNATGKCVSHQTCTSTFTVGSAPALVVNCPGNVTLAACTSLADITSAYNTWKTGFSVTGGCGEIDNLGTFPALTDLTCGGSLSFTLTADNATGKCVSHQTCTSTFTVGTAQALVATCPGNVTLAACISSADITSAYNTWKTGFSVTGGCGETDNLSTFPALTDLTCGGSLSFTLTADNAPGKCVSHQTCTSTFTVGTAPTVVLTCPQSSTVASCQTQDAVNSEFASWLGTVGFTGGCNAQIGDNHTLAPPACGGYTTVTWTVTSSCQSQVTCSATFTVTANTPPTITTCPSDITVHMNSGCGATVTLVPPTYSDNCDPNPQVTNNAPAVFPEFTTVVTWTVTDACGNSSTCQQNVTVVRNTLDGYVKYYNYAQTVMNDVTLVLNPGNVTITSGTDGHYSFPNLCANSGYTITATTIKPSGGVNATDAAQVNAWGVLPFPIEKVRAFAGDVITDNYLLGIDASRILAYFVTDGNPAWSPKGKWTFWPANDLISSNPLTPSYPETISILVSGASVTQNIWSLCTGDFNQSFIPGSDKEASNTLSLTYGGTLQVNTGDEFDLPLSTQSAIDVDAVSLILNFPSDKLQILGVTLADKANTPLMYNVKGDELRIGWYSRDELSLKAGDKMLTLRVKLISSLDQGETIRFTLVGDQLNELADAMDEVIPDAMLNIDRIGSTLVINPGSGPQTFNFTNYPNPFTGTTTLAYSLPANGTVTIELRNMLGVLDKVILDNVLQTSGDYKLLLNASDLSDGVYIATLKLITDDGLIMTRTIKIVRTN
jgi:hypothetical protein